MERLTHLIAVVISINTIAFGQTTIKTPTYLFNVNVTRKPAECKFIDQYGKVIINTVRYRAKSDFSEGFAAVFVGWDKVVNGYVNKRGYINKTGKMVIKPQFEEAGTFSEGLAAVKVEVKYGEPGYGKYGYIDRAGKIVIKPQFVEAGTFSEGLATVYVENDAADGWGYIDKTGKFIIEPKLKRAISFREGVAKIVTINDPTPGRFINKTGEVILSLPLSKFYMCGNYFSEGLLVVVGQELPRKSGFIDLTGKYVIDATFPEASDFSEGFAAVGVELYGKYGGITYGYIDRTGKMVINPQFARADNFKNGLAKVADTTELNWEGYINKEGKLVWSEKD